MQTTVNRIKNALSIDVEDWYQGILHIKQQDWPEYEDRLGQGLDKILRILDAHKAKATFFVLGYIAEKQPGIVNRILGAGHEVASHGYWHKLIYNQTPQEFREDIVRSKEAIERIIKKKVRGYRAPFFSITKDSLWALDILSDLGFDYDSSIFPVKNFLYGIPGADDKIHKIVNTNMTEFPLSVLKINGFKFPVCGGFYLRSLPYLISACGIRSFNRGGHPAVIYMHPWELDTQKPKIPMGLKWKIVHEYNIAGMENKFKRLIRDFCFTSIEEVLFG